MKRKLTTMLVTISFLVLAVFSLAYSQDLTPSFEDILNLKSPGSINISPDGKFVAYTVTGYDWENNGSLTQIWLATIATGDVRQMTFGDKSSSNIDWTPDSKNVSFVSSRSGKSQFYLMAVDGGEARKVTDVKTGIGSYQFSPCGKWFAFTATEEQTETAKEREEKYGRFDLIDEDFSRNRLWLCEVATGEVSQLITDDNKHVRSFNWSPDGKEIAFSANPNNTIKSSSKSDLYILNVENKDIRTLVDQFGPDSSPAWSPCGKFIAFTSSMGTETYFVNTEICVIPAGGGEITVLTRAFVENAGLMFWKENGIYFSAYQKMTRHLFRLNPETKEISQLSDGNFVIRGSDLCDAEQMMAFSYVNGENYTELYWSKVDDFKPAKLTDFGAQLDDWKLSTKEAISWKSKDGTEITGVLIKPADFDPTKKYPLFVIIHGGPTGISYPQKIDGYNRTYPIEQWAAKGAVFLLPNYRGSAGFGYEFRKLNYRNLGVGDYWDVISGVDYLIDQGFVDSDKVASMGWSQGGYISAYITTFSDRFAAVSVGAGISDWITYYYQTDITPFTVHYLGATPWEDPEVYAKTGPMTHINNAKTPTLIQHGELDRRVPTPNAYKLYRGLQDRGIPSRLIIYKGFGHGITKPKERLASITHNWDWFNKYIFGIEESENMAEKEKPKK